MGRERLSENAKDRLRRRRQRLVTRSLGPKEDAPLPFDPRAIIELEKVARVATADCERLVEERKAMAEEIATLRLALQRQKAEFDNYRRRVQKEKETARDQVLEELMQPLLQVVDNFDRAIAAAIDATSAAGFRKGIEMIAGQLHQVLRSHGLQRIAAEGAAFDPTRHEALAVEETVEVAENTVVDVMLPGYELNGRVIRPAAVRVAKPPQAAEEPTENYL